MKVLYIAHYFLPNMAAGVTTEEVIKMLLKKGHEVTLIAPSTFVTGRSETNYIGIKLRPAFTVIPRWLAKRSKLAAVLVATAGYISVFITGLRVSKKEGSFQAVIAQYHAFHLASFTSYLLSLTMNTPFIVKVHDIVPGSPTHRRLELLYGTVLSKINRIILSRASRILLSSTELIEVLTRVFKLNTSKVAVLPNSVDLNLFSSTECVRELRGILKFNEKKVVMFMASAFEDRGLDILLRALKLVRDKRVALLVVGPCDEKYKEIAQQLHIDDKTIFTGKVDYRLVPMYVQAADVCVGPLIRRLMWYGLIPRKVIEYMACGKPVIVARGTVSKDLAIHEVSAIVLDSADEVLVASAITSLVTDDSLSTKIGKEALRVVSEKYSTEKLADKLDDILVFSVRERNG